MKKVIIFAILVLITGCNEKETTNIDNGKVYRSLKKKFSSIEKRLLTEYCSVTQFNEGFEQQVLLEKGCLNYQIPICCSNSLVEYYVRPRVLREIDNKICEKYGILTFWNDSKYYCSDRVSYSICKNMKKFKKTIKSSLKKCKSGNKIFCEFTVNSYLKVNAQGKEDGILKDIDKKFKEKINDLMQKTKDEEKDREIKVGYLSKLLGALIKRKIISKKELSELILKEYESKQFVKQKNLTLLEYYVEWNGLEKKFREYNIQKEDCKWLLNYKSWRQNWRTKTDNVDYIKKLCVKELAEKGCGKNWNFRDKNLDYDFFKNLIPLKNLRGLSIKIDEGKVDQKGILLLQKLNNLEDLGFRKIKIPGILFKILAKLKKIERLSLHNLKVAPNYLSYIGQYKNLKHLQLYKMKLSLEFVKNLKNCSKLESIVFFNCDLTNEMLIEICKIKKLNYILLDNNLITDENTFCLAGLNKLSFIRIQNNDVSNKTMNTLLKIKNLNTVGIHNTKVNPNFLKQFKVRKSKIQIRNENYKLNNYFVKGDKPENIILIDYENKNLLFRIFYKDKYGETQVKWKKFNTQDKNYEKKLKIIEKMIRNTFPNKYKKEIYF